MESINLINPQGRGDDFTSFLVSFDVKKRTVLNSEKKGARLRTNSHIQQPPLGDFRERVQVSRILTGK